MPARPATRQALVSDPADRLLRHLLGPLQSLRLCVRRRPLLDRARQLHPQPLELFKVLLPRRIDEVLRLGARLVALPPQALHLGNLLLQLGGALGQLLPLRALGGELLLVELLRLLQLQLELGTLLVEQLRQLTLARLPLAVGLGDAHLGLEARHLRSHQRTLLSRLGVSGAPPLDLELVLRR